MKADEIINDLNYMKEYGEFFQYQHKAIDEAIALIAEYQSPETQRLIEIGRATEKAFVHFIHIEAISYTGIGQIDMQEFKNTDELVEWATHEGKGDTHGTKR